MKRLKLLVLPLLLVGAAVIAATASVSWQNATKNTDDTSIPASGPGSIASTRIEWSPCGPGDTFTAKSGEKVVAGTVKTATSDDLPVGRWCLRAIHINTFGVESDPSSVGVKVVAAPKPNPPSNFTVN